MSSNHSQTSAKTKTSFSSHFSGDNLSENDIEQIWKNFIKSKKSGKRISPARVKAIMSSVETTPTTDYGEKYLPLHPETEKEALEQDKRLARMNTVLKAKKMHPKSYLPQVILYDNVSHDRLLAMRMEEIRRAHESVEKRAKRREESFVKSLERKQQEWIKRDERIIAKLEPENLSEFNFTFGRLYSKADYPYQTVVQASYSVVPPNRKLDHARRRPIQLPQVSNRPIYDDEEEDKTFVTKLPKYRNSDGYFHEVYEQTSRKQTGNRRRGRNTRNRKKLKENEWTKDKRFHTLTSLLGDRYSPTNEKQNKAALPEMLASKIL